MAERVKLVAVDLDRTILRSDGTLSPFTVEVFRRLQRCGVITCALTARRKGSAQPICDQLACRGAALYNGAEIVADSRVIALHAVNWRLVRDVLAQTEGHPCSVTCEDGTVYTNYETRHSVRMDSWSQLPERDVLRVVLYKAPRCLLEKLQESACPELYIRQQGHGDIVVVSRLATKEQALKTLLEHWGLSAEEAVAFGDDVTDLGSVMLAGTGIAVQNACEEMKRRADMVCRSNDEDGPALWLNERALKPLGAEVL